MQCVEKFIPISIKSRLHLVAELKMPTKKKLRKQLKVDLFFDIFNAERESEWVQKYLLCLDITAILL
jgi:hypothetical protein